MKNEQNLTDIFLKRKCKWPIGTRKDVNITNYQEDAYQNHTQFQLRPVRMAKSNKYQWRCGESEEREYIVSGNVN